jgi:hypothetical protein
MELDYQEKDWDDMVLIVEWLAAESLDAQQGIGLY